MLNTDFLVLIIVNIVIIIIAIIMHVNILYTSPVGCQDVMHGLYKLSSATRL